jgi:hypothetical protein
MPTDLASAVPGSVRAAVARAELEAVLDRAGRELRVGDVFAARRRRQHRRQVLDLASAREPYPATGADTHRSTWAQAAAIEIGRAKTHGFEVIRRNASSVGHGRPTRVVPPSCASSQSLAAPWAGLSVLCAYSWRLRPAGSPVLVALGARQRRGEVVERADH